MIGERLAAQALAGRPLRTPEAVAERLLAVQAQDPRGFRLAVRARTSGLVAGDVDAALDERRLLVSWLNRGTLHLVTPEDYWLLHPVTTPQVAVGNARRLAQEGVPPDDADRGVRAIVTALEREGPLPREALRPVLAAAGVRAQGQALVHVLVLATLRGHVVRGPVVGREQAFVLVRDWLGAAPPPVAEDAALAEVARRYLKGHAPATERDLAKWLGRPLTVARRALRSVRGLLPLDGGLVTLPRQPAAEVPPPKLLGAFDPVLMGWESRAWVVEDESRLVDGAMFRPFALVDGRAAATWRYERGAVSLSPFAPLPPGALDAEAADVARFLG